MYKIVSVLDWVDSYSSTVLYGMFIYIYIKKKKKKKK